MHAQRPRGRRRGTTLVEGAVVGGVFFMLVLGTLDLGVGVLRYHLVAEASRQGARQAIVHGSLATALGPWGPATVGPMAADDPHPLAQAVQPYLVGIDPHSVTILAEWPDGSNEREKRVRVTVSVPYQPILTSLCAGPLTLQGSSTMPISH